MPELTPANLPVQTSPKKTNKFKYSESSAQPSQSSTPTPPSNDFSSGDDFIPINLETAQAGSSKADSGSRHGANPHKDISVGDNTRDVQDDNAPPAREWDRGKLPSTNSDSRRSDKKRKHAQVSNDGPLNKRQRSDSKRRAVPWMHDMIPWDRCNNVAEMLHHEVQAFIGWISPTPIEDEIRGLVVQHISQAITSTFRDAQVLPFGSYGTKLYLPSGDIDLVVISQSMAYSNKNNVLHAVANAMRRAGVTDTKVTVISKARVPIVKFVTTHGRFNVDISINQESGLVAGDIINSFLTDMKGCKQALRSLIMITKAFLCQRGMNEVFTGGLGSYSIVCMATSFLQMHPKIRRGEIDPEKNLGVLLMEFFELYGRNFNFVNVGISLRDGGTYFSKSQRWSDYSSTQLLSIEDPADPTNDISKGSYQYPKVRATFAGAYDLLLSTVYYRAGILHAKRSGRFVRMRSRDGTEDISILASIIGIPQETINHRKIVEQLYDSQKLHDITGFAPRRGKKQPKTSATSSSLPKDLPGTTDAIGVNARDEDSDDDLERGRDSLVGDDGDDVEEEGRYGIGRIKVPSKRLTEFTGADSSTDEELTDEDQELRIVGHKGVAPQRREERQAFWSAKGYS